MPKHKMITKSCTKCGLQNPVACKACPCGHPFLTGQRRSNSVSERDEGLVDQQQQQQRRRTERVKREKPNYYDALEYDKQMKKLQRKRNRSSTEEQGRDEAEDDQHRLKTKRKRVGKSEREREPEEDSVVAMLTPEKGHKCSLILSEINRKIGIMSWHI